MLPLGLFTTAVAFDIVYVITGRSAFAIAAGYTLGVGLLAGFVSSRAESAGKWHSAANVLALLLLNASWLIRLFHHWVPSPAALITAMAGLALAGAIALTAGEPEWPPESTQAGFAAPATAAVRPSEAAWLDGVAWLNAAAWFDPNAWLNPAGLNTTGLNTTGLNTTGLNTTGLNTTGLDPAARLGGGAHYGADARSNTPNSMAAPGIVPRQSRRRPYG